MELQHSIVNDAVTSGTVPWDHVFLSVDQVAEQHLHK